VEEEGANPASRDEVPDSNPEAAEESPEEVHVLRGILGLFTAPEIGAETEAEIKARHELNDAVHRMLILGLLLSTAALFAGLALSAITHHPLPTRVSTFREMLNGFKTASPPSILSLGILLLIATPVLRVFGSLVEFLIQRNWRYALITFSVLLILSISVLIGSG
jgi:uncharacterized membrane protein